MKNPMRWYAITLTLLVVACGGAVDETTDYVSAGCWTASPEGGGDESLCPAAPPRIYFVTTCRLPTVNPAPLETDCVETSYQDGRVWCCAPTVDTIRAR